MKKEENRYEKRQPNSDTREEFLIVLEYLQNYAYDEDHAASQAEIIEFAKKNYNTEIRRDRIGQILIHLDQICKKDQFSLPFVLKEKNLKKIKKYYIPQKMLSDKELTQIITALQKDKLMSRSATDALVEKLLKYTSSPSKSQNLIERAKKRSQGFTKVNSEYGHALESFNDAIDNKYIYIFKIVNMDKVHFSDKPSEKMMKKFASEEIIGYPYQIIQNDTEPNVVIYIKDYKIALITKFSNINVVSIHKPFEELMLDYSLTGKYSNIDEWIDKRYSGQDGLLLNIKLKVTINAHTDGWFDNFRRDFKKFWKRDMTFEIVDRPVHFDADPNNTIIAKDAHFEVAASYSAFTEWYINKGNFDDVVIVSPGSLNDFYLAGKINRYAKRLTKYGGKYNYTLTREIKPEYKEKLEKIRKRRA